MLDSRMPLILIALAALRTLPRCALKWPRQFTGAAGARGRAALRLLLFVLGVSAATDARAECTEPRSILLGDSIAGRMRAVAERDGYQVLAQDGARLSWTVEQPVGCVSDLVLVIGTNDLRDLRDPQQARNYVDQVRAAVERWSPRRAVWVTPSCFDPRRNPVLDRGSRLLHGAVEQFPRGGRIRLADGYEGGCPSLTAGDGVHPDPAMAAVWWARALVALRERAT